MEISDSENEVLLKIYIGQNIRKEGILQSEINEKQLIENLLSKGLIKKNNWYLNQFLTTDEGFVLGKRLVSEIIKDKEKLLKIKLQEIPENVLGFVINRYILNKLDFPVEKPSWISSWEDNILFDSRIWIFYDKLFTILKDFGLCIKTYNYVSTRGGELRDLHYVISPETQEFLMKMEITDFSSNQEATLKLYPVLFSTNYLLDNDDVDKARKRLYELLKEHSVTEKQLAGFINEANKKKLTSEYQGLLSENKPFEIIDPNKFKIYLGNKLLEPAINILLGKKGVIEEYTIEDDIPNLSEVKLDFGIIDPEELGEFYFLVSNFERQLRDFLKEKLGKGWVKRIENDLSNIVNGWEEKRKKDERWGIDSEKDFMNYADLGDYIQIIKKYRNMFSNGDDELGEIITHLKIWYNHGRNPIMHARTVDKQKYYTTNSAIQFLLEWMSRKKQDSFLK